MLLLAVTLGERELMLVENRFCSGVSVFAVFSPDECVLGKGWPMDRVLVARGPVMLRVLSKAGPVLPSIEVLVESAPLPALDMRLGRRF